ncbi:50S ribosomal protein L29 [Legionella sp. W05-934-2]|jgi:large subunit ribosomal protein L29|uniref:50S ribosomal protein L29 n=1 Tax=Legionella sp. W05-934-2 TaxID=1198649 RepID=UPI003461FFFE
MLTAQELKELSVEQLNKELLDLREKQFKLRFQRANGSLERTDEFKRIRRSIARIKTIITQKAG